MILVIKPRFDDAYSRNNLPNKNDWAYVINLDEYKSIRTDWTTFHVNGHNATYFDSFGVEYKLKKKIKNS